MIKSVSGFRARTGRRKAKPLDEAVLLDNLRKTLAIVSAPGAVKGQFVNYPSLLQSAANPEALAQARDEYLAFACGATNVSPNATNTSADATDVSPNATNTLATAQQNLTKAMADAMPAGEGNAAIAAALMKNIDWFIGQQVRQLRAAGGKGSANKAR